MKRFLVLVGTVLAGALVPAQGQVGNPEEIPEGHARIVLSTDSLQNPSYGFHFLLDSKGHAYERALNYGSLPSSLSLPSAWRDRIPFYDTNFDVRIPQDAEADSLPRHALRNGSDTLYLAEGVYDYVILYYDYASAYMYKAGGSHAAGNDTRFEAGKTYHFLYDGQARSIVYRPPFEIGLASMELPGWGHALGTDDPLAVKVYNGGTSALEGFTLWYCVQGQDTVKESPAGLLLPGDTLRHVFSRNPDFSAYGTLQVSAGVFLEGDLAADNNVLRASLRHPESKSLPFHEDFESRDSLSHWTTFEDASYPGRWDFRQVAGKGALETSGFVNGTSYRSPASLYLISDPIEAEAGVHHISFYYTGGSLAQPEQLKIWYGSSSDLSSMHLAGEIRSVHTPVTSGPPVLQDYGWEQAVLNLELPEKGTYYFAFQLCTENGRKNIYLDEITIDSGKYDLLPDIELVRLFTPVSHCGLAEDSIGVLVRNAGKLAMPGYALAYSLDGAGWQEETFADTLGAGAFDTVWFQGKLDFPEEKAYRLAVAGSCDRQTEYGNDTLVVPVYNFPVQDLPFHVDADTPEEAGVPTLLPEVDGSWLRTEGVWRQDSLHNGLLSTPCLYLPAGEYRVSMTYQAGSSQQPASFRLFYRPSGKDTARVLLSVENQYPGENAEVDEVMLDIDEAGDYVFSVEPIGFIDMEIMEFHVAEPFPYDVRLTDFGPLAMSAYVPAEQTGGYYVYTAAFENRGTEEPEVECEISGLDGEVRRLSRLDSMPLFFPASEAGSRFELKATAVVLNGEDGYMEDNSLSWEVRVTDTVMATEALQDFTKPLEGYFVGTWVGNVFSLACPDTLTSFTAGFSRGSAPGKYDWLLASLDTKEGGLSILDTLAKGVFEKQAGDTLCVFSTRATLLPAGTFFLALKAEASGSYVGEDSETGRFFSCNSFSGRDLTENLGQNLLLRANFAPFREEYVEADLAVYRLEGPKDSSLMGESETIRATLVNYGEQAVSRVPVYCQVDGKISVDTLDFDAAATVDAGFEADLSERGLHEVVVWLAYKGDDNAGNDTMRLLLHCVDDMGTEEAGALAEWELHIWPNPVPEELHIESGLPMDEISVYRISGVRQALYHPKSTSFQIPVSALSDGMYILKVLCGQESRQLKFVVEKGR